jgi:hypothetical protein
MPFLFYFFTLLSVTFTESNLTWITPQSHDFGDILRGGEATHTFSFKNTTNTTLTLDNVRTDCGCTATDWDIAPVPAGGTGHIKITYDAAKMGYFKKKITVWIRHQRKAEKLWIEGEVK